MSDLQEMIHKTSMTAHVQGTMREQERIIEVLEQWNVNPIIIEEIKGGPSEQSTQ